MQWLEPAWLHALWGAAGAGAVGAVALARRRRGAARFVGEALAETARRRAGLRPRRAAARAALVAGALALIGLALGRPAWNPTPKEVRRTGRDVVFLVDVSRSMLAEDVAPSRLERARLLVNDVLDAARGDRFGLVAFAGSAVVRCPLTTDYNYVRMCVADLSPSSVSRGGTLIGDAIRTALRDLFADETEDRYRDLVLITDGEDHESFPVEAAASAGQRGIRIIAVGLGSAEGAPVPAVDERGRRVEMRHGGEPVRSRFDGRMLERIAAASAGGVCLNVGTGTIDLERVYRRLAEASERRAVTDRAAMRYTEGFPLLLAGALVLLVMEGLLRETGAGA